MNTEPEATETAEPTAAEALEELRQSALRQVYEAIIDELTGEDIITQRVRNLAHAAGCLRDFK